jgi:hypothetical protein
VQSTRAFAKAALGFAAEGAEAFENFGGGRAGITGAEGDAAMQRGEGNGFVAAEEETSGLILRRLGHERIRS